MPLKFCTVKLATRLTLHPPSCAGLKRRIKHNACNTCFFIIATFRCLKGRGSQDEDFLCSCLELFLSTSLSLLCQKFGNLNHLKTVSQAIKGCRLLPLYKTHKWKLSTCFHVFIVASFNWRVYLSTCYWNVW